MGGNAGLARCLLSHRLEPKCILRHNQGTLRRSDGRLNNQACSHRTKFTTRSGQYDLNLKEDEKESPRHLLPTLIFLVRHLQQP